MQRKKPMGNTTWKDRKRVHLRAKIFARYIPEGKRVDLIFKNIRKPKEIATLKEIVNELTTES